MINEIEKEIKHAIENATVIRLKPTDTLVFNFPEFLPDRAKQFLRVEIRKIGERTGIHNNILCFFGDNTFSINSLQKVWLVLRSEERVEVMGIYTTEELAIKNCYRPTDMIGLLEIDKPSVDERIGFDTAYFPLNENSKRPDLAIDEVLR